MLRNEYMPTIDNAIANKITTSGLCRAHSISRRTISDYPNETAVLDEIHCPPAGANLVVRAREFPCALSLAREVSRRFGRLGFLLRERRLQLADAGPQDSLPRQERLFRKHSEFLVLG